MSGSAVSPGLSGRQTRKQQQEKSDESHDLGYESQAAWYPHNPHKGRISVHDHPALSDELPPLARIRTFPIEEGDPIITFWETIRVEVHHILEHANLKWNSLSILHRRQTIQRTMFDTTLVITAERNEWGSDWEEALRKCHEKTAYGLKGDIRGLWIELRAQKFSRVADSVPTEPEPSLVEIHEHNERPAIGKSIGVTALPWSSGTMGGFVEIKNTTGSTEAMVCVLTNHHVARPTKKPSDEPEAAVKYDLRLDEIGRFHAAVTPGSSPPLPVSQPSYQDHERTLRLYEGQIREQSSEVKTLQVRADTGDKRSKKQLLLVKASLEKLEKEYERVSHFDLDFGKVWASSGYIKSARTGGGLDWALVQVRKDRIGHNLLTPAKEAAEEKVLAGSFELMPSKCTQRTSLDFDKHEHKRFVQIGKRSGVTFGTVNRIRTDVRAKELPGQIMREIIVVGDRGNQFCNPGDSGAWVFDQYGALAGMSYGGEDTGDLGAFVTPIDEVAASILELTGCEMRILNEEDYE